MTGRTLILRIVMAALATLALLIVGAVLFIFSSAGRDFVMARALPALSRAIDQQITVKEIGGGWPGHIELKNVAISDAKGLWLEIDNLSIIWHPLTLLQGRVSVGTLVAHDTHMLRLPESPAPQNATPPAPLDLNSIRRTLDDIDVEDLTIETLRVEPAVFGNPASIALRASLRPQGGAPTLTAVIDRYDTPGSATLNLALGDNTLALSARAVIAGVDLDAAVAMSGETESLSGSIRAACGGDGFCVKWQTGSLGAVTGEALLGGTRTAPTAFVTFKVANAKDGKRSLETLEGLVSVVPDLEAQILRLDGKGTADGLQRALPEVGTVLGNVGTWALAGTAKSGTVVVDSFTLNAGDTEATLAGTLTGNDLTSTTLTLNLRGAGRLAGYDDKASRTRAELKITKGTLAPQLTASGTATVEIDDPPAALQFLPAFKAPVRLSAKVALAPERLNLDALSGLWGPATLKGESSFAVSKAGMDHLGSTAHLTLAPNTFTNQTAPLQIEAKLNGGFAALGAAVTATLEDYQRGAAHLTDITSTVQARRDGANWQATVRTAAKLNDVPATLTASVSQTPTEIIADSLHLEGAGADLKGNLRYNKDRKTTTGTLNGPVGDLAPWTSLAGLPAKGRGDLKLALSGETHQRVDLTLSVQNLSTSVIGADYAQLTVALDDAFNDAKIRARLQAVDGDLSNRRFDQLTATANGAFKNIAVTLQAKGTRLRRFAVDLAGTVGFDGKTDITLAKLTLEDAALRASLPAPVHMSISDAAITLDPMRLDVGTGTISAQFDLNRKTEQVKSKVALAGLSLGDPKDILSSGITFIDGTIDLSGPMTRADATAEITARFQPRDGGSAMTGKLTAHTQNGRAIIAGTASGLSATDARLNADIPAAIDLSGPKLAMDMQAPVSGTLTWRGEIKSLWQLLGNEQHTLAGQAVIDLKVAGNMDEPVITGGLRLTKGLYENLAAGTALHNIDLNVAARSGSLVDVTLAATDTGSGTLSASGSLRRGGDVPGWSVDMAGDLKQFYVLRRDDVTAAASGHFTYKGPALAGTIGGDLQIVKSEYRLGESYQPDIPILRGPPPDAKKAVESPIRLNVTLSVPEVLRTEGQGLEAFWRGDIKATGDIAYPDLVGQLTLARGTFSFLGKTFDLESGTVTFTGGGQINPELNIVATRQAEEITATVTITGRATEPQITLSSQPALPQDEVLARLLFRRGTTQLGPIESLQLANAAADLSGISRGGLSGVLRRASGLDIVGFGGESGNAIVLGRQFSSALYVGIEQNVNDSTRRIVIEWRLTRQFSLQSTTTGEAGADLGVLWRKNY